MFWKEINMTAMSMLFLFASLQYPYAQNIYYYALLHKKFIKYFSCSIGICKSQSGSHWLAVKNSYDHSVQINMNKCMIYEKVKDTWNYIFGEAVTAIDKRIPDVSRSPWQRQRRGALRQHFEERYSCKQNFLRMEHETVLWRPFKHWMNVSLAR
jgi:hypothetical protein